MTVLNEPPVVSVDPAAQTVQYSDLITPTTITVVDSGPHLLSIDYSALPSDLAISSTGCSPGSGMTCTWQLTGQILEPVGEYTIVITGSDGLLDSEPVTITVDVIHEDVRVSFDTGNTVAEEVDNEDDSGLFTLTAYVMEYDNPDDVSGDSNLAGDITKADIAMVLDPVGPGTPKQYPLASCTETMVSGDPDPDSTFDYDVVKVECDFDDVPVNVYTVQVEVSGNYYDGLGEDVFVVFDPDLGFTTGGGWFYWPGTADGDYPGDKTNFGYNMKYNKKRTNVQGSLLLIRHLEDGSIYRVKSNALDGLAIGAETDYGWASFAGKATYKAPGEDNEGNHRFLVYVEDWGTPGAGADKFWFQLRDKDGQLFDDLTLVAPAHDNAVTIEGGNIVVPHVAKKRGPKNQ